MPEQGDPDFAARLAEVPEFAAAHAASASASTVKTDPCAAKTDATSMFQIAPHQRFVRSFMSASTPYNGLLLFHGLGSGKTCAAMQVAEETFNTLARTGTPRRTFVVAAPNLQAQFKANLFDADKLVQRNGVWTMPGCVAPELLHEALPDPRTVEPKETIVRRLEQAVARRYAFVGPDQLANMVAKVLKKHEGVASRQQQQRLQRRTLTEAFGHRLYIIDEAHDLRVSGIGSSKNAWDALKKIAEKAEGTKLLMLTATPVFDSARDIISLVNLLLLNDGRKPVRQAAYFDPKGDVRDAASAGRLAKDVAGYVSFVSSQDTDAFPFLLSPSQFGYTQPEMPAPQITITGAEVQTHANILDLANVSLAPYQGGVLAAMLDRLRAKGGGMGIAERGPTIMALNFVYPGFDPSRKPGPEAFVSAKGLLRCVRNLSGAGPKRRPAGPYVYDPAVEKEYGDVFAMTNLRQYSAKMHRVLEETARGEGIVLVYSQYLEAGAVPIGLCLERAGYVRRDGPALWDAAGPAPPAEKGGYILITGDKTLSPNNTASIAQATAKNNTYGERVKVVVISQAGSQGVDLHNVRQVHMMDPWYNLGRAEQIVGRARRRCSHIRLPVAQRNVSVYMYATLLPGREEAPDRHIYNLAAGKAIEGGQIARALKEWSVDCWLSGEGTMPPAETVGQVASNGTKTEASTAPREFSFACDYQATCAYKCGGRAPGPAVQPMYSDRLIEIAGPPLLAAMRALFTKRVHYSRDELHQLLGKGFTELQIDAALTALVTQPEQWVVNPRGLPGHVQNIGLQYLFAPVGLEDARLSLRERLAGGVQVPQAIEVEAPDVKLGTAKVYNDADDGAKLARVIWRRASRELQYVPLPPGTQDISWGWGAINAMYDPAPAMRAHKVLAGLPPLPGPPLPGPALAEAIESAESAPELVRHILAREVEVLSQASKLSLLRAGAKGLIGPAIGERGAGMLVAALRNLAAPFRTPNANPSPLAPPAPLAWTGTFVFGDIQTGALEYYTVSGESVRHASPDETAEFRASRGEALPAAAVHGTIGPHQKTYLVFRVVDTRAKAKQAGWQCRQASKRNVLNALEGVVGSDAFSQESTKRVGSARELCIDLEVILRYYQARGKDGRQWMYTYEQLLLARGN